MFVLLFCRFIKKFFNPFDVLQRSIMVMSYYKPYYVFLNLNVSRRCCVCSIRVDDTDVLLEQKTLGDYAHTCPPSNLDT